jgi:multiple sugar transport system substrate-binding protein
MRGGMRRTIDGFALDFAGLPSGGSPISVLHSDAYSMTAASDAKEAEWRSMEFALGPEGQRITSEAGRTVPSPRSVAGSDTFLDPDADPRHARSFLDQVPSLRAVPIISTWPEIEDTANGLLEEAYSGGGRALEVAAGLATQTRDQFARDET